VAASPMRRRKINLHFQKRATRAESAVPLPAQAKNLPIRVPAGEERDTLTSYYLPMEEALCWSQLGLKQKTRRHC